MNKFLKCILVRFNLELVSPLFLLPLLVIISAFNFVLSIVVIFVVTPILLCHVFLCFDPLYEKKFFYVWSIVSFFLIFISFEILTVPLMVISPSENIIFYVLFCCILLFTKQIQENAPQSRTKVSHIYHGLPREESFMNEKNNWCLNCCVKRSGSTSLCGSCLGSSLKKTDYNVWIGCPVGCSNRKNYHLLLFFSLIWLGYTSYLTLTTYCTSYLVSNSFLIPSDCSGVYDTTRSAICFVSVLYGVEMISFIVINFIHEYYRTNYAKY